MNYKAEKFRNRGRKVRKKKEVKDDASTERCEDKRDHMGA